MGQEHSSSFGWKLERRIFCGRIVGFYEKIARIAHVQRVSKKSVADITHSIYVIGLKRASVRHLDSVAAKFVVRGPTKSDVLFCWKQ